MERGLSLIGRLAERSEDAEALAEVGAVGAALRGIASVTFREAIDGLMRRPPGEGGAETGRS